MRSSLDELAAAILAPRQCSASAAAREEEELMRWREYWKSLETTLRSMAKCQHFIDVYLPDGIDLETAMRQTHVLPVQEIEKNQARIAALKTKVMGIFQEICAENMFHVQWMQLGVADEQGLVDTEGILCSLCGAEDKEGDDILFCDKIGCYRAYHERCIAADNRKYINAVGEHGKESDDWLCPLCMFIDDCMLLCMELLDSITNQDANHWWELFTDLAPGNGAGATSSSNSNRGKVAGASASLEKGELEDSDDEDEDEDGDYEPSVGGDGIGADEGDLTDPPASEAGASTNHQMTHKRISSLKKCESDERAGCEGDVNAGGNEEDGSGDSNDEEDDEEGNDGDADNDEEGDYDDSLYSIATGVSIEDDELKGLLQDAEQDCLDLPEGFAELFAADGCISTGLPSGEPLKFQSGRPRRRCTMQSAALQQQKDPRFVIRADGSDVGKEVARVFRGCVENGTIRSVKSTPPRTTVEGTATASGSGGADVAVEGESNVDGSSSVEEVVPATSDPDTLLWQVEFESGAVVDMNHKKIL